MGLTRWFLVFLVLNIASSSISNTMICPYADGNLSTLRYNSLPSGLVNVSFINHPISDISPDAFENSATTLTSLYFKSARFVDLPQALLKLTSLTTLVVNDIQIKDWNYLVLEHIGVSIRELVIQNVNLTHFPSWLSLFKSIVSLDISRNFLPTIQDNAFGDLEDTLQNLILADTGLSHLSIALSILNNLTSLSLDSNNLSSLQNISCAEHLSLSDNNISNSFDLVSALLPCAHVMSVLTLTSNKLTIIPDLSNMVRLETIYLDKNQISDAIYGSLPTSITHLYLQGNRLTLIPPMIGKLLKLSVLDLSSNRITWIHSTSLPISLTEIYLEGNCVTEITKSSFPVDNSLVKIQLDSNPLYIISVFAFTELKYIRELYLGRTDLTEVPIALTDVRKKLEILRLNDIPRLICSCPPKPELVEWYTGESEYLLSPDTCNDGQFIRDYLRGMLCRSTPGNGDIVLGGTMNRSTVLAETVNRGIVLGETGNRGTVLSTAVNIGTALCTAVNRGTVIGTTVNRGTVLGKTVNTSTVISTAVNGDIVVGTTVNRGTVLGKTVNTSTVISTAVNGDIVVGTTETSGSVTTSVLPSRSCYNYIYFFPMLVNILKI